MRFNLSGILKMSVQNSSISLPSTSTQTTHPALELTEILGEIFPHLGTPHELLQYRFVCQKWNDVIVHSLKTKWKNYFPLLLRYGPHVPLSLNQSEAERWSREILESPIMTLTGSNGSTTPLSFDTVIVDREFYMAGVNSEWEKFLEINGESIRNIKFNIRSGKIPEENSNVVANCAQLVSRENLRAAFSAVPNLESLDFSVRFNDYGTEESEGVSQRMFPEAMRKVTDLPQLKKLTKMTIQQPRGSLYIRGFLRDILGMAPNLTTLNIKWSTFVSTIADVLRALPHLDNSITSLGISMTDCNTRFDDSVLREFRFSRLHLTKLELNNISGHREYLEEFLQSQSSTLTTLILGDRSTPTRLNMEPRSQYFYVFDTLPIPIRRHSCTPCYPRPLSFPPVMESLKILDLNLFKYNVASHTNYQNRFPSLEELTFSNCEDTDCFWEYQRLLHLLPGEPTQTVKKFSLLGQMRPGDRNTIIEAVRSTFPVAEYHFGL